MRKWLTAIALVVFKYFGADTLLYTALSDVGNVADEPLRRGKSATKQKSLVDPLGVLKDVVYVTSQRMEPGTASRLR